jgi:hypothetical protein
MDRKALKKKFKDRTYTVLFCVHVRLTRSGNCRPELLYVLGVQVEHTSFKNLGYKLGEGVTSLIIFFVTSKK